MFGPMDMKMIKNSRLSVPFIVFIFIISFLYRFAIPCFYPSALRADEIFQVLEPAHRQLTGHGVTTWEWQAGIRNWAFPDLIADVWRVTDALGLGHSPLWIQGILCFFSLGLVAVFMGLGRIAAGRTGLVACGLMGALWPDLVLGASRTATEMVGGNLLALGTIMGMIARMAQGSQPGLSLSRVAGHGITGLYTGSAFFIGCGAGLRFQLMPAAVLTLVWMVWWCRRQLVRVVLLATGFALPVLVYGLVDLRTYGTLFGSVFRNVHANIGQNIAASYGTAPFYFYIIDLLGRWQVAFVLVIGFFIYGFRQFSMPAMVAVAVILSHSLIGHKEPSFIYGAIPLLLVVATVAFSQWVNQDPLLWSGRRVMLGLVMIPLLGFVQELSLIHIRNSDALIRLQQIAARQPDICGLAFPIRGEWSHVGGYSYFPHHDVPLYFAYDTASMAQLAGRYNYLITYGKTWSAPPEDKSVACLREFCLFRVESHCSAPPDYEQFGQVVRQYEAATHAGHD
ncbi:alg9 family protein mannosyltransferase [Komagataeibacter medellinensis NBRC 3288]|uniref:Alg9 family protein mannosyltransferase n=1 Tax=Komagataeibacter medellinensis (strain NBRC 3288 / BCRC 11682 / LMG 1693 / Kondo 51) TaxID=634177 RepID=G2I063_KOMMN|nr:alg9 family protein mannosyltransferase [Komagataeibacter medellinensis NBRC 3288]